MPYGKFHPHNVLPRPNTINHPILQTSSLRLRIAMKLKLESRALESLGKYRDVGYEAFRARGVLFYMCLAAGKDRDLAL